MASRGWRRGAKAGCIAAAWVLAGCGQDAPPYDALPLRDALRATPEVVASLSLETRREVAERMEQAAFDEEAAEPLPPQESATIDALSRSADELREDRGQDAIVFGEVVAEPSEWVVTAAPMDADTAYQLPAGPILLRGRPSAMTVAFEDAALRGHAGQLLREFARRANTEQLVRTTGLPMGAWAHGGTLYVNASWLVAMSALEESESIAQPSSLSGSSSPMPKKQPLSIDFNPYNLPDSIVQCANQVEANCACGNTCSHEVTDPTFANAVEECAWVNQAPANSTALCVLALLSIDAVRACVESGGTCSALPVTSRDDALAFVQDTTCMQFLDQCLANGSPFSQSSSGSSCKGCNDCDCSGCSDPEIDTCSSCNDDCAKCNEDCAECNQNWDECNENCKNTDENAKSCGKCSVRPRVANSTNPIGSTFWLFAPVAYLMLRSRRRR